MSDAPTGHGSVAANRARARWIKNMLTDMLATVFAPTGCGAWADLISPRLVQSRTNTVTPIVRLSVPPPELSEAVATATTWANGQLKDELIRNNTACSKFYAEHKQPKQAADTDIDWANESLHRFHNLVSGAIDNVILPLLWAVKSTELKAMAATEEEVREAVVFTKKCQEYVEVPGGKPQQNGASFDTSTISLTQCIRTNHLVSTVKGSRKSIAKGLDGVFLTIFGHTEFAVSESPLAAPRYAEDEPGEAILDEWYAPLEEEPAKREQYTGASENEAVQLSPMGLSCHHGLRKEHDIHYPNRKRYAAKVIPKQLTQLRQIDQLTSGSIYYADLWPEIILSHPTGIGEPSAKRAGVAAVLQASMSKHGLTLQSLIDSVVFISGATAMGPTGSQNPQNTSAMIHFMWHHTLRWLLLDNVVIPKPSANKNTVALYKQVLATSLYGEFFKSRPRKKPPQDQHHHGIAALRAIAVAGLPLSVNWAKFGNAVTKSVAVFDVVDAVEDLAATHDINGTNFAGHSLNDRLALIRQQTGYIQLYEVVLESKFTTVILNYLWRHYQTQVRAAVASMTEPNSVLNLAVCVTPLPWTDPLWAEYAKSLPCHPLLYMVAWCANELGRLAGTKEVSFATLDSTSDIGHTHTIYYLPETLYVAVAVCDKDGDSLSNAGFIKSSSTVVLDSAESLMLPQLCPHEHVPWTTNQPPDELLVTAVLESSNGVLFASQVSNVKVKHSLWDMHKDYLTGTVGRIPYANPVPCLSTDSPSRLQMPPWVFKRMCLTFTEQTMTSYNVVQILLIPYEAESEWALNDNEFFAAAIVIFLVMPDGNAKKVRVFYLPPKSLDELRPTVKLPDTSPERRSALAAHFMNLFPAARALPVADDHRPTSPRPRSICGAQYSPSGLVSSRLANLEVMGHNIDIETGILAVCNVEGPVKVLTVLVDLIADDCENHFRVSLSQAAATDGFMKLREIWHVYYRLEAYEMRIIRLYSTLDKAAIQKLTDANYRLELDVTTKKDENQTIRRNVLAIEHKRKVGSLMNTIDSHGDTMRKLAHTMSVYGGPIGISLAKQMLSTGTKIQEQLKNQVNTIQGLSDAIITCADANDTVGATEEHEPTGVGLPSCS